MVCEEISYGSAVVNEVKDKTSDRIRGSQESHGLRCVAFVHEKICVGQKSPVLASPALDIQRGMVWYIRTMRDGVSKHH